VLALAVIAVASMPGTRRFYRVERTTLRG